MPELTASQNMILVVFELELDKLIIEQNARIDRQSEWTT